MHPPRTLCFLAALLAAAPAIAAESVKIAGLLEFRKPGLIIVDGQRIATNEKTKYKGSGKAKTLDTAPLGYMIQGKGKRGADGTVLASSLEATKNDIQMFEKDVLDGTNQAEQAYVKAKMVYEPGPDGKPVSMGKLYDTGPQVERARTIVDRLLPSYVDPKSVRVYVVENPEWNAMAMANYSIYVFSGLMKDMDDDELAIVLGHEIAHATYEHSRRQASKSMIGGIAGTAASIGSEMIGNPLAKAATQGAASLGVSTFGNAFSREYEDQADRVGLRYVYEAGYDYTKAPKLWERFAQKYGDGSKIENFFFGDHSLSSERAKDLRKEIANNYSHPEKDPPTNKATAGS